MSQIDYAPNVLEASEARKRLRQQQHQPREIRHVIEESATTRSMAPTPSYEYESDDDDVDGSVPEPSPPPSPQAPVIADVKHETKKTKKTVETTQWSIVIPWTLVILSWTVVLVLAMLVATQASPPPPSSSSSKTENVYPLWTATHDTASVPISLQDSSIARPLLAALEYSFRGQFEMTEQYECLCMTHLVVPHFFGTTRPSYQVCGVYNRPARQLYMMVNPVLVGMSNQTDAYLESSVACGTREQSVKRARHIFVEWTDPTSRLQLYARFIGLPAAAIQLALDEMNKGVGYCASSTSVDRSN